MHPPNLPQQGGILVVGLVSDDEVGKGAFPLVGPLQSHALAHHGLAATVAEHHTAQTRGLGSRPFLLLLHR